MAITSLVMACALKAAALYGVPSAGVLAIIEAEGGRPGLVHENGDGSRDLGPMQVNSLWLPTLAAGWGVDPAAAETALLDRPCTNVSVGTWILADCIRRRGGDFWQGVGCYHAPSDPARAAAYAARVSSKAAALFGRGIFAAP